jgi:hypothetical protein
MWCSFQAGVRLAAPLIFLVPCLPDPSCFQEATTTYFEYVKAISDWARDKLNPIKVL